MFRTIKSQVMRVLGREPEAPPEIPETQPRNTQLAAAVRLGDKYPPVKTLALSLSIRAPHNEFEPTFNGRSFGSDARAYFGFKCKNPDCVDGGFDLNAEIDEMVSQRRPEISGRRVCQGWESRALIGQRRCMYELNFKAVASYRS